MDRSCGTDGCPNCHYKENESSHQFRFMRMVKILAICKAPWVGGFSKVSARPLAIVSECPKCFDKFWYHTTKSHKECLEGLLNEGVMNDS